MDRGAIVKYARRKRRASIASLASVASMTPEQTGIQAPFSAMPAQARIQVLSKKMDARLRGHARKRGAARADSPTQSTPETLKLLPTRWTPPNQLT